MTQQTQECLEQTDTVCTKTVWDADTAKEIGVRVSEHRPMRGVAKVIYYTCSGVLLAILIALLIYNSNRAHPLWNSGLFFGLLGAEIGWSFLPVLVKGFRGHRFCRGFVPAGAILCYTFDADSWTMQVEHKSAKHCYNHLKKVEEYADGWYLYDWDGWIYPVAKGDLTAEQVETICCRLRSALPKNAYED